MQFICTVQNLTLYFEGKLNFIDPFEVKLNKTVKLITGLIKKKSYEAKQVYEHL